MNGFAWQDFLAWSCTMAAAGYLTLHANRTLRWVTERSCGMACTQCCLRRAVDAAREQRDRPAKDIGAESPER
jgi:hypothetical protein